jgi:hypothetical protein
LFGLALASAVAGVVWITSPSYDMPEVGRHGMTRDQIRNTLRDRFQLDAPLDSRNAHCEMAVGRAGPVDKDVTYLFGCRLSWTEPEMTAWLQKIARGRPPDAITPSLAALDTMRIDPPFDVAVVYDSSVPGKQLWYGPTVFVNEARTEAMAYYFEYLAVD